MVLTIGFKIQLLVGASFLLGLAGVFGYQTNARINSTWDERMDANLRIVRGLAAPARGAIDLNDSAAINSYMELLSSDPRASGIVLTSGKSVMVSQQSIEHFELPIDQLAKLALESEALSETKIRILGDYEYVAVPVKNRALRTIGSVGVAWNVKGLLEGVWYTAIKEALGLFAVVAGVILILVFAMRKLVTNPLNSIAGLLERPMSREDEQIEKTSNEYEGRTDEIGTFARALSLFYRRAAETSELHHKLDSALTNMSQGLCMFDRNGRLVVFNQRFAEMYKLDTAGIGQGITRSELVKLVNDAMKATHPGHSRSTDTGFDWITSDKIDTATFDLSDGRTITVSHQPTSDDGWVTTHTDVSNLRAAERKLFHLANHDALTGLPNRRYFQECIEQALAKFKADNRGIAIHFLDLDKFKTVNDTMGHAAGDKLLMTVADRLKACVRQGDIVCRLGGDEFAIMQHTANQAEAAEILAIRVNKALCAPVEIGDQQARIGVSIGISICPQDGTEAAALLKHADLAVYVAKEEGRNTHRFYAPWMNEKQARRQSLEADLRVALENSQFELLYQPIVNLKTNRINSCEALIRWHHPKLGTVLPADFVPIAEETGLIVPIGEWAIHEATRQAALWPMSIGVSVNISNVQLQRGNLALTVFGALAASKLLPGRLHLEITESLLIKSNDLTLSLLQQLRGLGVRIVLDDFGTGYSALNYLDRFPFDKVKVDRYFIKNLGKGNTNDAIIDAIVSICRNLNIDTVAEGVETEQQREHLMNSGIKEMQGYLYSRPVAASDLQNLLLGLDRKKMRDRTAT
jgi:diguanylate cyclase (GGDEF)-like protein